MLLLEERQPEITLYTLPNYPHSDCYAKVSHQNWNHQIFPTLLFLEVTEPYRGLGLSYLLLKAIIKEHSYLRFLNYNPSFWKAISKKQRLPFVVVLNGLNGEIIKKCSDCLKK